MKTFSMYLDLPNVLFKAFFLLFFTFSLKAETVYINQPNSTVNIDGSDIISGTNWTDDVSMDSRITWLRGDASSYLNPTSSDDVKMYATSLGLKIYKNDIDLGSLEISYINPSTGQYQESSLSREFTFYTDNSEFRIENDLSVTYASKLNFKTSGYNAADRSFTKASVYIGGDVQVGVDGYKNTSQVQFGTQGDLTTVNGGPLESVHIMGNLTIANDNTSGVRNYVHFNVGLKGAGEAYDISDPDIEIKGVFSSGREGTGIPYTYIQNRGANRLGATVVFSVGGLDGKLSIYGHGDNTTSDYATKGNALSVLVLNNGNGYYDMSGSLQDSGGVSKTIRYQDQVKLKVVMNSGTQVFSGDSIAFSGGIECNGGFLLINSGASGTDGKDNNGKLYTHGDLTMNAGTFGFYSREGNSGGNFSLNNVYWKSGTIQLCVYENGTDTLNIEQLDGMGGNFAALDGADTVNFTFIGETYYLLDGQEHKVVSWSSYDKSLDYAANNLENIFDGQVYSANFMAREDGLYVSYQIVPEPADFALACAVICIFLAFFKRKFY